MIRKPLPKGVDVGFEIHPGKLIVVRRPSKVEPAPVAVRRRVHACDEIDRCSHNGLQVRGANGMVEVRKGQTKEVRVQLDRDGYFHWQCGNSRERTRPTASRTVIAERTETPAGRRMR